MVELAGPRLQRLMHAVDGPGRSVWLLILLLAVAEFGLPRHAGPNAFLMLDTLHILLLGLVGVSVTAAVFTRPLAIFQEHGTDLLLFAAALTVLGFGDVRAAGMLAVLRFCLRGAVNFSRTANGAALLNRLLSRPALALTASFGALIGAGTILLMAPSATVAHTVDSPLTALFTATSATCVTGLSVVDVGTHYTRFGQWVILGLMQAGGLGIITLTSALSLMLQRGLSKRMQHAAEELMETETLEELRTLLVGVVALTLLLEMAGTAALFPCLLTAPDGTPLADSDRLFHAAFHAVSAWCNAGFSLYPDSLARYVTHLPVNAVVMTLIILGGIGATVLMELVSGRWLAHGPRMAWDFLSLHTKLAITTSTVLVVVGAACFALFERTHSMRGLSAPGWLLASLFQSVGMRTAGFATIDLAGLAPPTVLVSMALMFIGGSSGGTAGGIKTTTVAVIAVAVRTTIRGRQELEVFGRSIRATQVYRALMVVGLSGALLSSLMVVLLLLEPDLPAFALMFEAVSAFSTTGHSLGLTPQLSSAGRLLVAALMFIGRVGPFTLALAVGSSSRSADINYPTGRVIVG